VAQARRLSHLIRTEHLSFAATGNPGWGRYTPHERDTRVYDADCTIARYPEERARGFWRDRRFGALGLTK
jgi:para-nitrobenzyl esterase